MVIVWSYIILFLNYIESRAFSNNPSMSQIWMPVDIHMWAYGRYVERLLSTKDLNTQHRRGRSGPEGVKDGRSHRALVTTKVFITFM